MISLCKLLFLIIIILRNTWLYSPAQAILRTSFILAPISTFIILDNFIFGFWKYAALNGIFSTMFFYNKCYLANTYRTDNNMNNGTYFYFKGVSEAEKAKIEHQNYVRLQGIEMNFNNVLNEDIGGHRMI